MTFLIDPKNPSDVCGTCGKKSMCPLKGPLLILPRPILPVID